MRHLSPQSQFANPSRRGLAPRSPFAPNVVEAWVVAFGLACILPTAISGQGAVVRDSSGVRIVENSPPGKGVPLWSVAESPELVIGGTQAGDESFLLHWVWEARFLSTGGIVVGNGAHLLWFDSTGRFVRQNVGRGEGPAESLHLARIEVLEGDTVIAFSKRPPALKVFAPDGLYVRAVTTPALPSVVGISRLETGAWAGITFGGEFPPARTGVFYELWHVKRYTADLRSADTLLSLDGRMFYGNTRGFGYVPGGPRAYFAAHGGVVVAGESDTYELKVFSADGTLRRIIRNSMPNSQELRLVEPASTTPDRPSEFGVSGPRLKPPILKEAPAYDGILIANDGALWVRRHAGPDAATVSANTLWSSSPSSSRGAVWVAEGLPGQEWHVYDQEGWLSARALLPPRFRPTEIADSRILGVWKDELGVESVHVLRLIRR